MRGPGDLEDLAKVQYQCVQENRTAVSGGYANGYGAATSSQVIASCSELRSCMAAHGYFQDPNGNIDATSIAVRCRP